MRNILVFTLALAGLAVLTDDASAFGRKKRGGDCGGGCGSAVVTSSCGGCGSVGYSGCGTYGGCGSAGYAYGGCSGCGSAVAYSGSAYGCAGCGSTAMYGSTYMGGSAMTVQGTDGATYYRGHDGSYYVTPAGAWSGPTYRGGVYQAGYPGTYYGPGVTPASGTQPLQMPGIVIPGGFTVPVPMPNK